MIVCMYYIHIKKCDQILVCDNMTWNHEICFKIHINLSNLEVLILFLDHNREL